MCYALLTTCHTCTWVLTVSYPRCSHAKAYALDPSACPHRMKRRYKTSGQCPACTTISQDTRKQSLSVMPCEVRIEFRDTAIGTIDENDKVQGNKLRLEKKENRDMSVDKEGRKNRARRAIVQSQIPSTYSDSDGDGDGDVYIDSPSPSASVSSASSEDSLGDMLLPRKHKAGARPSPRTLPKPRKQVKKRKRSPGVLERVQIVQGVKKGRRGRPPKPKMIWPDRIDEGEFELIEEQGTDKRNRLTAERPVIETRKVDRQSYLLGQNSSYGSRCLMERTPSYGQRQSYASKVAEPVSICKPPHLGVIDEVDNLARVIALEAVKRDKKWR